MEPQKPADVNPIDIIRKSYPLLSPTQKQIADIVLDQAETVCFMRLEDFGKMIGVTNVTIIRFVKKLGYESFGAFKKELQNYVQTRVIPMRIVKSEINSFRDEPTDSFIRSSIQNEFDLMQATYDSIPPELLLEAAEIIKNARRVYIVGTGLNEPVTEILQTRLSFLCLDVQILYEGNVQLIPYRLINVRKEDVFIIFSFPNYKDFSINVAKCVHDMGCHTICITDRSTAPIAYYAEKLLLCQTSSLIYYNSMTAPVSLVTLLSGILALQMPKDAGTQERLDHIASFFK